MYHKSQKQIGVAKLSAQNTWKFHKLVRGTAYVTKKRVAAGMSEGRNKNRQGWKLCLWTICLCMSWFTKLFTSKKKEDTEPLEEQQNGEATEMLTKEEQEDEKAALNEPAYYDENDNEVSYVNTLLYDQDDEEEYESLVSREKAIAIRKQEVRHSSSAYAETGSWKSAIAQNSM